jgi:hypothetical protein
MSTSYINYGIFGIIPVGEFEMNTIKSDEGAAHHCRKQRLIMRKPKQLSFADKMNQFNDEFIELEIRIMRELIRFVDAHKPTPQENADV